MADSALFSIVLMLFLPVVMAATTTNSYSKADLLELFPSVKARVPLHIHHRLKELGIGVARPTKRGRRSWSKRQKPIPFLSRCDQPCEFHPDYQPSHNGAHLTNLVHIPPTSYTEQKTVPTKFDLWNARSIKPKITVMCDLVISNSIDIFCITETWLSGDNRDHRAVADLTSTLPNYQVHHIPRIDRAGGGVCVLLRESFDVHRNEGRSFESFEHIDLSINARSKTPLRLIVIYRPQRLASGCLTGPAFFTEFSTLLESVVSEPGYVLISGDFNFHVDDQANREAAIFLDLIDSFNLEQHVTGPTHCDGHTLDLLLTRSTDDAISHVSTTNYLPSDHAAVKCLLNINRPDHVKREIRLRELRKIDIEAFRQDVLASPISTTPATDLDSLVHQYDTSLGDLLDKHAPQIWRTISSCPHAPWYNEDIRKAKRQLRKCERRWMSSRLMVHKQLLKEQSYHYNQLITETKSEYHRN